MATSLNILTQNFNIVSGLVNSVSALNNKKFLTIQNPSGTGIFNFNGNENLSGNLTVDNIYCTNNNINESLVQLTELTNNLSGAI